MTTDIALNVIFDEGSYYDPWDIIQKETKIRKVAITKSVQSHSPIYVNFFFQCLHLKNREIRIKLK